MAKARPLALPNVTQETIARQAYRLFGAMKEVEDASAALADVRRKVSEVGVDPGILADVMKEAKADPAARFERDRTLAQYIAILKPPGIAAVDSDLFEDVEDVAETDEEREAREYSEGFWSLLTHAPVAFADLTPAQRSGYDAALTLVNS